MKKLTCNISQKYFEQCIPKIHQVRILNLLFLKFTQYLKVSLCARAVIDADHGDFGNHMMMKVILEIT